MLLSLPLRLGKMKRNANGRYNAWLLIKISKKECRILRARPLPTGKINSWKRWAPSFSTVLFFQLGAVSLSEWDILFNLCLSEVTYRVSHLHWVSSFHVTIVVSQSSCLTIDIQQTTFRFVHVDSARRTSRSWQLALFNAPDKGVFTQSFIAALFSLVLLLLVS